MKRSNHAAIIRQTLLVVSSLAALVISLAVFTNSKPGGAATSVWVGKTVFASTGR